MRNKRSKLSGIRAVIVLLLALNSTVSAASTNVDADKRRGDEPQQESQAAEVQVNFEEEVRGELDDLRKLEALKRLKEVLGIKGKLKEENRKEIPPQFMMELYHTVTDSDGKTKANNPYNAKVVRSFIERDTSSSHLYIFNVSGLEPNESVLEAELHLYRKRSSANSVHPSVLSSPYYLIKVYQVLEGKSLEEPDLHRLLNVHYVGAFASGWQIFNVKQAVLSWLSGAPNLGFIVTASTIFGDHVTVDYSRRNEQPRDKQPILVLFNDDQPNHSNPVPEVVYPEEEDEAEETERELDEELEEIENEMRGRRTRNKRHGTARKGQLEVPDHVDGRRPEFYRRQKRPRQRDEHDVGWSRKTHGFVSKQKSLEQSLTSMDIYERAMLRERLNAHHVKDGSDATPKRQGEAAASRKRRDTAASSSGLSECRKVETEPCAKRDLNVNFKDIGLTTIIAPESYAAYQCRGHCQSPLSQDQKPTNHATIQGIVHKMNVTPNQDVQMPCCVPANLSSISILYHDDERDGVVLKSYTDMVVVSCGCR